MSSPPSPPPLSPSHSISYETWYYWDASGPFYAFTAEKFADVSFPEHLKGHSSSPFVWLEHPSSDGSGKNSIEPIGGCDHFCEWIQKNLAGQVVRAMELKCFRIQIQMNRVRRTLPLLPRAARPCLHTRLTSSLIGLSRRPISAPSLELYMLINCFQMFSHNRLRFNQYLQFTFGVAALQNIRICCLHQTLEALQFVFFIVVSLCSSAPRSCGHCFFTCCRQTERWKMTLSGRCAC